MMFCDIENIDTEPNSWIQPSCYLPSISLQRNNSCQSFLGLPEMPLQPSVSTDMEFLSDWDKQEDCLGKTSVGVQDGDVLQSEKLLLQPSSFDKERDTQLKRSRHEVHSISERKRRSRINGKLKTLQELMPHCTRKDRASVLDEAAKYIKALKQHVETMSKLREFEYGAPYVPYCGNPGLQLPLIPIQQGTGMCVRCSTPFFQLPLGVVSSSSSTVASFCVPTTHSMANIEPTSGSYLC